MNQLANQTKFLKKCLLLAKRGEGKVAPNPMVAALLVYRNTIIGSGYHKAFGKPHAEIEAIKNAMKNGHANLLDASTLYINLEPCCHHGKTPPCTETIIANKIPHVVVTMQDPNPKVAGKGIKKLKSAGVKVELIELKEAMELNKVFIKNITTCLPYIHVKVALTKDGQMTAKVGTRTKITNKKQDIEVHRLRARYDAILVGRKTVEIDNPKLTCRLKELTNGKEDGKNPIRIVLDSAGTLLHDAKYKNYHIFDKSAKTIIASKTNHESEKVNLKKLLKNLFEQGIRSVLVEGGAEVIESFKKENLADEYTTFRKE